MPELHTPWLIATFKISLALGSILAIAFMGRRLAPRHGSDIRLLGYFFWLTVVLTVFIAFWAQDSGAIDTQGRAQNRVGGWIVALLGMVLDVDGALYLFGAILALVVLPQWLNYLCFSGPFGCASAPILAGPAVGFFVISMAKTMVVAAAVLMTLAVYGWTGHLGPWSIQAFTDAAAFGLASLALAFQIVYLYRDAHAEWSRPLLPDSPLARAIKRLRAWAARSSFVGPQRPQ